MKKRRSQQKTLFEFAGDMETKRRFSRTAHGGDLALNKRKLDRPLSSKKPIHIVLRSSQAKGVWSFLGVKNQTAIDRIIARQARKFGVTVQDFANVGNHLHLKIKAPTRARFQAFLRSVTCLIARKITGARRGIKLKKRFWDGLAFTRVLTSWREEVNLRGYFIGNRQEAGLGQAARERFLRRFQEWVRVTYIAPNADKPNSC